MPRAFFSTNLGQHPPRPLEEPLPSTIVRSDPELDKHVFGMALRDRWPLVCKLINHSFDVSDYFDDLDVHVQGKGFLWTVLKQLAYENTVRRERITMFAMDWSRTNIDRFEALKQETKITDFFTDEETDGVGEEWLSDVFVRLKDLKVENKGCRGNGAWTRNAHRRYSKALHNVKGAIAGHRPTPQPNANSQVTSPQQFQPLSVSSPVYTPSMVSSGSWSGYQPPMSRVQDGYQWANIHGSPQLQPYRAGDTLFNQFHPASGMWDVRGPLPSPRLPPDLSQNAFGDPLHNYGSVAARRSRAPPHLRLDAGSAQFDGVQHQTSTPPPYTAAPLAQGGYSYDPNMAFGGAGPIYNPQLHVRSVSQSHHIGGNAWPISTYPIAHVENNPPIFPQSNRPNPVVDTRDPSYVPGDVRLLEPGPTIYDARYNETNHGKSVAKHAFVKKGLKDRDPDELRLGQMDISGEGTNGQDKSQVGQLDWNVHNYQSNRESSSHGAISPELGNAGRVPLFDRTNRTPYDNTGQLGELPNNKGLPHKPRPDPSCSVFVGRLPPSTTKEKLFEVFNRFGPITSIFLRSDSSCFAYINFYETGARNAAITGMNGFVLDGYTLSVEPRRYNREFTDRTTRKTPGNSDTSFGSQTGNVPHGASHRVHAVPGVIAGLVSRLRRDSDLTASQQPQPVHIPNNQQTKNWIRGSAVGSGGPRGLTDVHPQHGHPCGPDAVENTTERGYMVHNSHGIENSYPQNHHGDTAGSNLDYPPVNLPAASTHGGHDNVGATPPKSLKKGKKSTRNKKYLKGQNMRKGGGTDSLRSPVHEANPLSQSDIASDSGRVRSRDNGTARRSSF